MIVSYSDVRVLSSSGAILHARPHIHFPISVRLLVFRAVEGQLLRGVVSKVSPEHLGALIHGVFSAVIAADHIPPHYHYLADVEVDGGQRREAMLVDTRTAQPAQLRGSVDPSLSKKAEAKRRKAQEKEERRAAYLAAHGGEAVNGGPGESEDAADAAAPTADSVHHPIRVGSVLLFSVLSVHAAEGFFSLQGSLTAEGARLQPGEPIRPRAWREREALEERERKEREEEQNGNSVERLFGAEGEADEAASVQPQPQPLPSTTAPPLSKKEMKERKRAEKAERRAAKAQRRLQRREERGSDAWCGSQSTSVSVRCRPLRLRSARPLEWSARRRRWRRSGGRWGRRRRRERTTATWCSTRTSRTSRSIASRRTRLSPQRRRPRGAGTAMSGQGS